jgi:hypothetical protein
MCDSASSLRIVTARRGSFPIIQGINNSGVSTANCKEKLPMVNVFEGSASSNCSVIGMHISVSLFLCPYEHLTLSAMTFVEPKAKIALLRHKNFFTRSTPFLDKPLSSAFYFSPT